ncbi:hypothetical protein AC578_5101 [Pseudocercospora eumusae]|uniref:Uncharacterized protein n=1 Tax=Pseudocercospora eumusae TaxID=321146 RepID=A0A139HIC9_9PEZI|nr:hypothetical protein AC578_5101 [Pseudocercospora eumusae]
MYRVDWRGPVLEAPEALEVPGSSESVRVSIACQLVIRALDHQQAVEWGSGPSAEDRAGRDDVSGTADYSAPL